jgi:hypothetical protein
LAAGTVPQYRMFPSCDINSYVHVLLNLEFPSHVPECYLELHARNRSHAVRYNVINLAKLMLHVTNTEK